MEETLKILQELQMKYLGKIDISIKTRKDMNKTCLEFCNYTSNFEKKSKLYIYKLDWNKDNTAKIEEIKKELDFLDKIYN